MKKTVYTAEEFFNEGSYMLGETLAVSFDRAECMKAAEMKLAHLTERELEKTTVSVQGYSVPVEDGQTAAEAYEAFIDDQCCMPDPAEYEVINASREPVDDIETSAASLYDGGWRSSDLEEIIREYDLRSDDAERICARLAEMEQAEKEDE